MKVTGKDTGATRLRLLRSYDANEMSAYNVNESIITGCFHLETKNRSSDEQKRSNHHQQK